VYSEATIRPDQKPSPGTPVELDIRDDAAPASTYRWVQVEGPQVVIEDPARRSIRIEVPAGSDRLAFLRFATNPGEVRVVRFVIPVQAPDGEEKAPPEAPESSSAGQPASPSTLATGPVRADAGDDQVGLVGHRVTLNGSRSTPASGLVFRWIQVGGPPILAPQQERSFYSFIPTNPGLYQFALVVGGNGTISEPDSISVLVGALPTAAGTTPAGPMAAGSPASVAAPAQPALPSPEAIVASAVPRLPDGPRLASEVADVFEAVAGRSSLYNSFGDLQSELSRRLDVVIPSDPNQRLGWSQTVLQPLTQHTVNQLLAIGMDVRQPAALNQPLAPAQKERVREHFQSLARAFRDVAEPE
jgi:hypothetical protein